VNSLMQQPRAKYYVGMLVGNFGTVLDIDAESKFQYLCFLRGDGRIAQRSGLLSCLVQNETATPSWEIMITTVHTRSLQPKRRTPFSTDCPHYPTAVHKNLFAMTPHQYIVHHSGVLLRNQQ